MDEKTSLFIEQARKIHGDFYDYRKTKYVDIKTRVIITCQIHGDFQQRPSDHVFGDGCRKCEITARVNKTKDDQHG